ncbi:ATP-dependent protease [Clostridium polyendosporum]|uniref:endopeptidase La n=2 Tax=Clostridium polyendosporum TaxID=69208 RepID=A0A919RXD7_9CLOT|nr:ATP-dependent protease [Clostridium polyendosporum]
MPFAIFEWDFMKRELTPQEVVYTIDFTGQIASKSKNLIPEYCDVYKNIETGLSIDREGFNIYLVDTFSKEKLTNIINYIDGILKSREAPKDICYITYDDTRYPKPLFLSNGRGKAFKERVEAVKNFYFDKIFTFYNSSSNKEKEDIIDEIQKKRSDYISGLVELAKSEGFDVKTTNSGFAFIPLKEGEAMTEKDYENLEQQSKDEIITKAGKLKTGAEDVLEQLKDIELNSIEKIKKILERYLIEESSDIKEDIIEEFTLDKEALDYFEGMFSVIEKEVIEGYSMNFEEDEDKINDIINKFAVNVIVDNQEYDHPRVIFEEDPSISNLIGTIEYETHNGAYSTDVSLITSGSILNANEGCLIIRASSLVNNPGSYYYLRKTLMANKVSYDYNRGYLEFLALNGLKPNPIDINLKVVIIGDYETFDILYTYDEDFKKLFRIKAEYNPYVSITDSITDNIKASLISIIKDISDKNNLFEISIDGINEVAKYLSRKAGNKKKLYIDDYEIDKLLMLANNIAKKRDKRIIGSNEIISVAYSSELIEKEIMDLYKDKKILVDVTSKLVGSVNGLSVIDTGYYSFGKPTRITCICCKGSGRIIDTQRESNLSGNIHCKSINILRGLLNSFLDPYNRIPVDFYVSFEQIYGMLEGDSASVAEIVSMISALSKIPINQNIAVTGSLNQFGEVQPIGGVNEKIEGFFKVCKLIHNIEDKGVLIPYANKDELILVPEVEEAVKKGQFHIYTMKSLNDALQVLLTGDITTEDVLISIKKELELYLMNNRE